MKPRNNFKITIGFAAEKKYSRAGFDLVIGLDEAGRGPLAGPVFAAAVAFIGNPKDGALKSLLALVDDSKKLSSRKRREAYDLLIGHSDIVYGCVRVSAKIVDRINILQASKLAMQKATQKLLTKISLASADKKIICLIDGNFSIKISHSQKSIIKGDAKVFSIAAASIIAKVQRDCLMEKMDEIYPEYGFARHKGYGTKEHFAAIKKHGPCPIHRHTFAPIACFK